MIFEISTVVLFSTTCLLLFLNRRNAKTISSEKVSNLNYRQLSRSLRNYDRVKKEILEYSELYNSMNEKNFDKNIEGLAKTILDVLEAQFCSIGFLDSSDCLEDKVVALSTSRSQECEDLLARIKKRPINETIVGNVLLEAKKDHFFWNYNVNGLFNENTAKKSFPKIKLSFLSEFSSKVLQGEKVKNMAIVGIYAPNGHKKKVGKQPKIIGYINVINKFRNGKALDTQFNSVEKKVLELFANFISLQNQNREFYNLTLKDKNQLDRLNQINNIEDLFKATLGYFNKEFNSLAASYWMVVDNGFKDEEPLMVLRSYDFPENSLKIKDFIQATELGDEKLLSRLFKDQLTIKNQKIDHTKVNLINLSDTDKDNCWKIDSDYLITIPILKSEYNPEELEKLWGIICLRPREFPFNTQIIKERLENFSSHLKVLFEKAIYQRRYQRLNILKEKLKELKHGLKKQAFYDKIVEIVKETTDSESCSIFFPSENRELMVLTATTVLEMENSKTRNRTLIRELINKPLYKLWPQPNSITSFAFTKKESVLMYNVQEHPKANLSYSEVTESPHKSYMAIPVLNKEGNAICVLRCINKRNSKGRLIHVFVKGDLDLLEIVSGILSDFITRFEFEEQKEQAYINFAHESRGPMQGITTLRGYIDKYIRVNLEGDFGLEIKTEELKNQVEVLENVLTNTSSIFLEETKLLSQYKFSKTNLKQIIVNLANSMVMNSNNKIITLVNKAPELYVDEKYMRQVFFNLFSNADRYSNPGTDVKVVFNEYKKYPHEGWFEFTIENFGIGIEEEDMERIFEERFYRSASAKRKSQTGTGIGLKVCKEIIEAHKGVIRVSQRKNPTIISILLPKSLKENPES